MDIQATCLALMCTKKANNTNRPKEYRVSPRFNASGGVWLELGVVCLGPWETNFIANGNGSG